MKFQRINKQIFFSFLIWRFGLFLVTYLASKIIIGFGGRFPYYDNLLIPTGLPSWVWGFGNFDGVHYLRIAMFGYEGSNFSQAFFPLFPLLIKIVTLGDHYLLAALTLSNLLFLASLYIFYHLIKIDYKDKIPFQSIILLLAFPTAFYFGSVYSESLFFLLTVSSLFLMRRNRFLEAGLLGALASSTRVLGLLLIPVLLIEIYQKLRGGEMKLRSEQFLKALLSGAIIPLGTLIYMWYLKIGFGDPLYFLNSQPAFGAQRSSQPFILLPQVLFRYFKMLVTVPVNSWQFFSSVLELTFTLAALILLFLAFRKVRFSYWLFSLGCILVPTLTGTLSSMPRYSLMVFLLFPFMVGLTGKYFKPVAAALVILQVILVSLFTRGYWVA